MSVKSILENKVIQKRLLFIMCLVGVFVLLFRLVSYLQQSGADLPSDDDIFFIGVIDQILAGTFNWKNYLQATFQGVGHSWAMTILVYLVSAAVFHWNTYYVIYFGIFLSCLEVYFLYRLLQDPADPRINPWLLLGIAAFEFGATQLGGFEHEMVAMQFGFFRLGAVFGLWAIWSIDRNWVVGIVMPLAGIAASYSWAPGLLSWPFFFVALLLHRRKIGLLLSCILGGLIGFLPYMTFLKSLGGGGGLQLLNFPILLKILSLPVTQDPAMVGEERALVGLALAFVSLVAVGYFMGVRRLLPGLLVLLLGLAAAWQISLARFFIFPHYSRAASLFWVGTLFFVLLLSQNFPTLVGLRKSVRLGIRVFSWFSLATLVYFYLSSNLNFSPKTFLSKGRRPVSSACLLHFETAPTYCDETVMQWNIGARVLENLGSVMKRYGLSVFGPQLTRSLQGESILNSVQYSSPNQPKNIFWAKNLSLEPGTFQDAAHLYLMVGRNESVTWRLQLPKDLASAKFLSQLSFVPDNPDFSPPRGGFLTVAVKSISGTVPEVISRNRVLLGDRQKLEMPLVAFAGNEIEIQLSFAVPVRGLLGYGAFYYPRVEIKKNHIEKNPPVPRQPENSSLNPNFIQGVSKDFKLSLITTGWKLENLKAQGPTLAEGLVFAGEPSEASATYLGDLELPLAEWDRLEVESQHSSNIPLPQIRFQYQLKGEIEWRSFSLPLLAGGDNRKHDYPLRLLDLPEGAVLTGLRLQPFLDRDQKGVNTFTLTNLRLTQNRSFDLPRKNANSAD